MKFFRPLLMLLFHLGYFGPLVMGIMDSSFLFLPFGNDLVVVGLVAQNHHDIYLYVLSAAVGSTIGALILALAARKIGKDGICKIAGEKRFEQLKKHIGKRSALTIATGALAPPPFPYTIVIAAASALEYPIWRILVVNFLARAARFTLLAWLAYRFGTKVLQIAKSPAFFWCMVAFIVLCLIGSVYSIWHWLHHPDSGKKAKSHATS